MENHVTSYAWAAGLFEGEGCITIPSRIRGGGSVYRWPHLSLVMTDEDVVRRFATSIESTSTIKERRGRGTWKDSFVWSTSNAREVERILTAFMPYFGVRRTERALETLEVCKNIGPPMGDKTRCTKGHLYTEENTLYHVRDGQRHRYCRACANTRQNRRRARKREGA